MYNPLYQLTLPALVGLINQGSLYWVQQSYPRGIDVGIKAAFLLTPYDDPIKAEEHFNHIVVDQHRHLYRLHLKPGDPIDKDEDGKALFAAAKCISPIRYYLPYTDGKRLPGWLGLKVKDGARAFGWGGRNTEIEARLGFHYGELVIRYFYKNQQKMIPLVELEKS